MPEIFMAACWCCGRVFRFNALTVPSIPIDPTSSLPLDLCPCTDKAACSARSVRQPICNACIREVNPVREQAGLTLWREDPNSTMDETQGREARKSLARDRFHSAVHAVAQELAGIEAAYLLNVDVLRGKINALKLAAYDSGHADGAGKLAKKFHDYLDRKLGPEWPVN